MEEKTGGGFTGSGIAEEVLGLAGGKGKKHRMLLNGLAAAFWLLCFCVMGAGCWGGSLTTTVAAFVIEILYISFVGATARTID